MSTRPVETHGYRMNHTMLRVKDPKASLKFYQEVLGMDLIATSGGSDFTLYFLAYDHSNGKATQDEKQSQRFLREGIVELTHNHGTENDANFVGYHNGNKDPRGFGHIAITVPDVQAACDRFEKLGVPFQKKLTDGRMRHIAFILDPDGYWVEVLPNGYNSDPSA
ncbi:Lactoylglutathione lyase [Steccherinum ochraceum]|uniref:Lactoylglutathione lyase n=1 Tax=Steccherinum ochraceum TaxID=92696 RepID=A0A4R0RDV0_9APHY|nr:Lactoylglutathione lyase [Steccherinum ochraceum]